jgi:membrane fusion protein, multidrug efflux system
MTSPNSDSRPASAGKGKRFFSIAAVAVLVLGAGGYGGVKYVRNLAYESTDNAFVEGVVVRVSPRTLGPVVRVAVQDNQHVAAGDLLVEIDSKDIQVQLDAARAALKGAESRLQFAQVEVGTVRKTAAAAVEVNRKGVQADEAAVETAKVRFSAARGMLEQAKTHLTAAEAGVAQARAADDAAEAEAQRTGKDLERYEKVFKEGGITPSQFDLFTTTARSAAAARVAAQSRIAAAEAQVVEAKAAIGTAEENVRQAESGIKEKQVVAEQAKARLAATDVAAESLAKAEAERDRAASDVEQLKAQVRQAELNLSYTRVVAPQAGTVTKKSVEVGDYVRPGQALLGLVADEKWIVANFKETQLERVKSGQTVDVRVDAYPDVSLKGRVDSIQRGTGSRFSLLPAENATGNYVKVVQRVPVKIILDGPIPAEAPLSLGMSVIPYVRVK